jgi:hypothetical protein
MNKETLKKIFDFFERKENKKIPLLGKWVNNEQLTEEDLNINGDLDLRDLKISFLPKGLKVSGFLLLKHCKELISLPEGLKVGGTLALESCTKITSLPKGLEFGGSLSLKNCINFKFLPENLEIRGFLALWGCKNIESLPKGLKVNGDLNIVESSLLNYTDDELREMVKPGFIKGEIYR